MQRSVPLPACCAGSLLGLNCSGLGGPWAECAVASLPSVLTHCSGANCSSAISCSHNCSSPVSCPQGAGLNDKQLALCDSFIYIPQVGLLAPRQAMMHTSRMLSQPSCWARQAAHLSTCTPALQRTSSSMRASCRPCLPNSTAPAPRP